MQRWVLRSKNGDTFVTRPFSVSGSRRDTCQLVVGRPASISRSEDATSDYRILAEHLCAKVSRRSSAMAFQRETRSAKPSTFESRVPPTRCFTPSSVYLPFVRDTTLVSSALCPLLSLQKFFAINRRESQSSVCFAQTLQRATDLYAISTLCNASVHAVTG